MREYSLWLKLPMEGLPDVPDIFVRRLTTDAVLTVGWELDIPFPPPAGDYARFTVNAAIYDVGTDRSELRLTPQCFQSGVISTRKAYDRVCASLAQLGFKAVAPAVATVSPQITLEQVCPKQ